MASEKITTQDQIFSRLKICLESQKSEAAFCCGGSSKINDTLSKSDVESKEAPPVILHWASGDQKTVQKVVFSQGITGEDDFKNHIQHLAESCQPASFGKGGQAIMDGKEAHEHHEQCFSLVLYDANLAHRVLPQGSQTGSDLLHYQLPSSGSWNLARHTTGASARFSERAKGG